MKYNKVIIIILTLMLFLSGISYAKNRFFTDVPTNKWYSQTVDEAYNLGLIKGYDDQTFKPEENITRAETTQLMLNVYKSISNNIKKDCCEEEKMVIDAVVKTLPKTVVVKTSSKYGSGFFVSKKHIVTNWHVVSDAYYSSDDTVYITMFGMGTGTILGKVIKKDENRDLALIAVDEQNVEPIVYTNKVELGQTAIVIGNPLGYNFTVTKGIVSQNRWIGDNEFTQIDSATNAGNSGGLVVNIQGELIGVAQSKVMKEGVEGLSFAIPYQYIRDFILPLKE